jgi:hypothetical protein
MHKEDVPSAYAILRAARAGNNPNPNKAIVPGSGTGVTVAVNVGSPAESISNAPSLVLNCIPGWK